MKLPAAWAERGLFRPAAAAAPPSAAGPVLLLAGSCSARTLEQIGRYRAAGLPAISFDLPALFASPAAEIERVGGAAARAMGEAGSALVHSSMPAPERDAVLAA